MLPKGRKEEEKKNETVKKFIYQLAMLSDSREFS